MRKTRNAQERFWEKVEKTDTCWVWQGSLTDLGYGKFFAGSDKGIVSAHRFAYKSLIKKIGPSMTIDHLCRNKFCVNPAHLEEVTIEENIRRALPFVNRKHVRREERTECIYGHPYTPENTMLIRGGRACKVCYAK